MNIREHIIKNLSGRTYAVNALVAVHGLPSTTDGLNVLNDMVQLGEVFVERIPVSPLETAPGYKLDWSKDYV